MVAVFSCPTSRLISVDYSLSRQKPNSRLGAKFEFSDMSWTVPAGEEISITFQNNGSVQHEWAVINLGMDLSSGDDFTEEHALWEIEKQDPRLGSPKTSPLILRAFTRLFAL